MTIVSSRPVPWHSDRIFYTGMSIAMAVTVFAGFSPTYYLKGYFDGPSLPLLLHAHGAVFTAWLLLFFSQTVLIANRRTDIHRKLGVLGAALAVVMVPLGVAAAVGSIRANHTPPGLDPRSFLVLPLFDIAIFIILVCVGISYRMRSETHKRLMLLATIAMLDAAVARLPGVLEAGPLAIFGLQDLFLVACLAYDFASRRRIHPAYVWGVLLIAVMQPVRLVISQTPWWLAFGDWLKG